MFCRNLNIKIIQSCILSWNSLYLIKEQYSRTFFSILCYVLYTLHRNRIFYCVLDGPGPGPVQCVWAISIASFGIRRGLLFIFNIQVTTRMHSSRMPTAHSSSRSGGSIPGTPPGPANPLEQASLGPGTPPWPDTPWTRHSPGPSGHPPVNRITDTWINITFPQLRLRAVTYSLSWIIDDKSGFNNWMLFCVLRLTNEHFSSHNGFCSWKLARLGWLSQVNCLHGVES